MGGVISQNGRPVAYWSRKLNAAQNKYPTIEQELLAIVECLEEFCYMLLGQRLKIYTNHKNLTYQYTKYANNIVLCQRLVFKEFNPQIIWINGEKNIVADTLSPNPQEETQRQKINNNMLETYQMDTEAKELTEPVPVAYDAIFEAQRDDKEMKELQSNRETAEAFKTHQYGPELLWTKQSKTDRVYRIFVPQSL